MKTIKNKNEKHESNTFFSKLTFHKEPKNDSESIRIKIQKYNRKVQLLQWSLFMVVLLTLIIMITQFID